MARYLNPQSDLVFKRIFGEHENLLRSFLNAILPLAPDQHIVSLTYLASEQAPVIPELKRPIVDVKCTDDKGRVFIVEMQIEWVTHFMQRMLFNAGTAYVKQLPKGCDYNLLQPVYGVALLANNFDQSDQWYHHYKIVNVADTQKTIEGLQLVFVELRKFKAQKSAQLRTTRAASGLPGNAKNSDTSEKFVTFAQQLQKLQTLWLRFMSELDEHTVDVPEELLAIKEIKEAVTLSQESAFTRAELEHYERYWDSVSSEVTLMNGKFREGKAEGIAEGKAQGIIEGEMKGKIEGKMEGAREKERVIVRNMHAAGMAVDVIANITGLPVAEIEQCLRENGAH